MSDVPDVPKTLSATDVHANKLILIRRALEKQQFKIALDFLCSFLLVFPHHPEANLLFAEAQIASGESLESVNKHILIATMQYSSFDILLRRIRLLQNIGQFSRVEKDLNAEIFQTLNTISGENLIHFVALIWELFAKKEYSMIALWVRLLVERFSHHSNLHYLYALILHYGHIDHELALKHYTLALNLGMDKKAIKINTDVLQQELA